MTTRTRTRFYGQEGTGSAVNKLEILSNPIVTNRVLSYNNKSTCVDYVGPLGNGQALSVNHIYTEGAYVSSAFNEMNVKAWQRLDQFPLAYFNAVPSIVHLSDLSRPPNAALANQLVAGTNPSRPEVDIPINILELKDLPSLLYSFGKNYFEVLANANIRYQFAIRPLVNDFIKLANFTKMVDSRLAELNKLKTKGLRRKVMLWSGTVGPITGSEVTTNSSPSWMTVRHIPTTTTTRKVWGFIRWSPNFDLRPAEKWDNAYLHREAVNAVLGLTLDGSTLWELLPWSWLVDYFSSVGDWIASNRNIVPATPGGMLIMETTSTDISYEITTNPTKFWRGIPYGNVRRRFVSKSRTPVSAILPSADLSLLTKGQTSILASLGFLSGAGYNPKLYKSARF